MQVATHDGIFHADEVFADVILCRCLPGIEIIRTRNPKLLAGADLRIDVGGVYNGTTDFDHHQRGGAGSRDNGVPYASAGLVWKTFGMKVIAGYGEGLEETQQQAIWREVDEKLIQSIDAADCGYSPVQNWKRDVEVVWQNNHDVPLPAFPTEARPFSIVISGFNPSWDDEVTDQDRMRYFEHVSVLAGQILENEIFRARGKVLVRSLVLTGQLDGQLLILGRFCPWHDTVFEMEIYKDVLFVVYPDVRGQWMVQAIPDKPDSFGKRKPLPEAWAGLRAAEETILGNKTIEEATGVVDAIFCHPGRFICGARSKAGAIQMAQMAVTAS